MGIQNCMLCIMTEGSHMPLSAEEILRQGNEYAAFECLQDFQVKLVLNISYINSVP